MELWDEFERWINLRETIRAKKEAEHAKPWTDDPVFQSTYFCNVRREDDKVTKWIRKNWDMHNSHEHALAMGVARYVNRPESLSIIGYPYGGWTPQYRERFIARMSEPDSWGGAYLVSTNGRKMAKPVYIGEVLDRLDCATKRLDFTTLAGLHQQLTRLEGIGSFMSGQIIADLKNTPDHPLQNAPDWWDWCCYGPGSLRGMAWLYGWGKCTPTLFERHIGDVVHKVNHHVLDLHAQDVQNCLCEFDKYMRVKTNTGRSKRNYDGVC